MMQIMWWDEIIVTLRAQPDWMRELPSVRYDLYGEWENKPCHIYITDTVYAGYERILKPGDAVLVEGMVSQTDKSNTYVEVRNIRQLKLLEGVF